MTSKGGPGHARMEADVSEDSDPLVPPKSLLITYVLMHYHHYMQAVLIACRTLTFAPHPKDATTFSQLASVPVSTSDECGLLLQAIVEACLAHYRNRVAAGPIVIRRVLGFLRDGLVTDANNTLHWSRAVRFLLASDEFDKTTACNTNLSAFVSAGGPDMLLKVMCAYLVDGDIASLLLSSLLILARLDAAPSARMQLLGKGCAKVVQSVMAAHLRSEHVQRVGCDLIIVLAGETLMMMGGRIVGSMGSAYGGGRSNPECAAVCQRILGFEVGGDVAEALVRRGALSRVYAAMDAHPMSVSVQTAGCGVFAHLAPHMCCSTLLVTTGGLDRLYAAMAAHPSCMKLQDLACRTVRDLASLSRNAMTVAASGALSHVLDAMRSHRGIVELQEAACRAVSCLTTFATGHCVGPIFSGDGLTLLCAAMASHSRSEEVQGAAIAALQNLTEDDRPIDADGGDIPVAVPTLARIAAVKASPAAPLVHKAMSNHPDHNKINYRGGALLRRLK